MQPAIHTRIGTLVHKQLSGELSHDERMELDAIIASSDEYRKLYEDLTNPAILIEEIERMRSWDVAASWEKTAAVIFPKKRIPVWKVVAAAAVLFALAVAGGFMLQDFIKKKQYVELFKAKLKTGKGDVFNLAAVNNGPLEKNGSQSLIKTDTQLVYPKAKKIIPNPQTDTLETPNGGLFQVKLPDGSLVWLNSTSSISYPTSFSASERTVKVTGEAFFDITKDTSRPFIIEMQNMQIQVTGTRFNLRAYKDEEIKATLFEGSVKIQAGQDSATLKPGEQAVLTKEKKLKKLNGGYVIRKAKAWRQGDFNFHGDDLKRVMEELGRWYNYEVEYKGPISGRTYEAEIVLERGQPIREILSMFQLLSGYKISIKGRTIIVNP